MKLGKTIKGTTHIITNTGKLRCKATSKITEYIEGNYRVLTCKTCIAAVCETKRYLEETYEIKTT